MLLIAIFAPKPNRKAKSGPYRSTLRRAGKFWCGIGDTRSDKVAGVKRSLVAGASTRRLRSAAQRPVRFWGRPM